MPKLIDETKLFETVVHVFAERGYAAAKTQDIAERAGVNEATLYRRYGTKAALVSRALGHCLARSPFSALECTSDVSADLVAVVEAYEKTQDSYGGAVMTLLTEIPRHDELAVALEALMPNLARAAKIIAHHQCSGALDDGHPMQLLLTLVAPLMAEGLWSRAGAQKVGRTTSASMRVRHFLRGHAARAQRS